MLFADAFEGPSKVYNALLLGEADAFAKSELVDCCLERAVARGEVLMFSLLTAVIMATGQLGRTQQA